MYSKEKSYHSNFDISNIHFDSFSTRKGIAKLFINASTDKFIHLKSTAIHPDDPFMFNIYKELKEYFDHKRKIFEVKLDIEGTPFQNKVWKQLKQIPYGKVESYKDIAEKINQPGATRAVGHANSLNPVPIIIPCHRVINVNGSLGGYSGGLKIKEYLLEIEGCKSLNLFRKE